MDNKLREATNLCVLMNSKRKAKSNGKTWSLEQFAFAVWRKRDAQPLYYYKLFTVDITKNRGRLSYFGVPACRTTTSYIYIMSPKNCRELKEVTVMKIWNTQ